MASFLVVTLHDLSPWLLAVYSSSLATATTSAIVIVAAINDGENVARDGADGAVRPGTKPASSSCRIQLFRDRSTANIASLDLRISRRYAIVKLMLMSTRLTSEQRDDSLGGLAIAILFRVQVGKIERDRAND